MKIGNLIAKQSITQLCPPQVRRVSKSLFSYFDLIDERASKLQLSEIRDNDCFIVSYPKSGNTWIRFMLANMLYPNQTISFRNINQIIPGLHKNQAYINTMTTETPRLIKSHFSYFECYPKFIYVYRDGRDVMVSYYWFLVGREKFDGTFSEFLRRVNDQNFGSWQDHILRAMAYVEQSSASVLFLKYEDMLNAPTQAGLQIADFCDIPASEAHIRTAVEKSSFHRLKEAEENYGGPDVEQNKLTFFRSGQAGQWRELFSEADLDYFMTEAGAALRQLGYVF